MWMHPNLRVAYVAQHAFHHVELVRSPFARVDCTCMKPRACHSSLHACKHRRVVALAALAGADAGRCGGAQHLKSTPADYFWWRFKSGEDREGLEKVTRKVTAAEAAQKDADIKAVSPARRRQNGGLGLGLEGEGRRCSCGHA